MNNLERRVKYLVANRTSQENRFFIIQKVKVNFGKALLVFAALPLCSAWAVVPGMMLVGIKPTLWAKSKMIDFKERMRLRWIDYLIKYWEELNY